MNPLLIVPFLRMVPFLIAASTTHNTMTYCITLLEQLTQTQRNNMFLRIATALPGSIIGTPLRLIKGGITGAVGGLIRPWTQHMPGTAPVDPTMIFTITENADYTLKFTAGPRFVEVLVYNVAKVLVAVIIFIIIHKGTKLLINHTYEYLYYKYEADKNNKKGQTKIVLNKSDTK